MHSNQVNMHLSSLRVSSHMAFKSTRVPVTRCPLQQRTGRACMLSRVRSWFPASTLILSDWTAAGNTAAPIFLRGIVRIMHTVAGLLPGCGLDKEGLAFALSNPRVISYYLFDKHQTRVLLLITLVINIVEYVFFLASTMTRPEAQVLPAPTSPRRSLHLSGATRNRLHPTHGRASSHKLPGFS
jgi:hypothetical protein